jgi:hypothetical protein
MSDDWSIPRLIDDLFKEFLLLSLNDWIDARALDYLKFIYLLNVDITGFYCYKYCVDYFEVLGVGFLLLKLSGSPILLLEPYSVEFSDSFSSFIADFGRFKR